MHSTRKRTTAELITRSGDLKRAVVEFAERDPQLKKALRQAERSHFKGRRPRDAGELTNFLDSFVLIHELADGSSVLDRFIAAHPHMDEQDRAMLLGWRDTVDGVFEVRRREGAVLVAVNLIDDLTYRIRSNMGPSIFASVPRGSFLITRIVPVNDEWLLSGASSVLPASSREAVLEMAAEYAAKYPALVFRNPDRLTQAWDLQRDERRRFIQFFGSDTVIVPGSELRERLRAYHHFQMYEARDPEGKTPAERVRETYGVEPDPLDPELPPDYLKADTVGLIYDEVEGFNLFRDFGMLEATFTEPSLASNPRHRDLVLSYLEEPELTPLPIRRLAERDPIRASEVFRRVLQPASPGSTVRRVLGRPAEPIDFDWTRDGEALLRAYKASFLARPVLPGVTPLSDQLAKATRGAAAREAAAERRKLAKRRKQRG